ncbi:hypothetical protein KR222_000369, partial [Zaprionus bogoriensis]
ERAKPKKKKISAIIDSESEQELGESRTDAGMRVESEEEQQKVEHTMSKSKPKKISAIIDSESEQEQEESRAGAMTGPKDREQKMDKHTKSKPKKISAIIDSESEQEQAEKKAETEEKPSKDYSKAKPKKKISAIIDSDSEEKQQPVVEQRSKQKKKKKQEKQKQQQKRLQSDEEQSAQHSSDGDSSSAATQNRLKGIVDSESESERSHGDEAMEQQEEDDNVPTEKPSKSKPMRASAKKALDEMQAIQSEQQRLHREAHISVPYHQPKPRTLKEFLSRRTINQPMELALAGGSPMPAKREPRRSMALRMNSEELQAYAKLMEARAKEATEFFKSESEHEEEDGDEEAKEKDEALAEPMEVTENPAVLAAVEEDAEPPAAAASEAGGASAAADLEPTAEQLDVEIESSADVEASPTKALLVTEVVELPKLDMSTLSITPPSKPATPRISEAIRRLKDEKSCDVSPSLKGDANMVIDLETGDMFAKKPTGVDDLLQRLMKTREAKKHKTTETVNILSTAHGKLELSKVSIHLHEEEPVNKDPKPGAAYLKMQEHLKSLITKKRMEEMRKKKAEEQQQEEENDDMDVDEDVEYEPGEKPCKSQVVVNEEEEIVDAEAEEDEEAETEEAVECAEEAEPEAQAEAEAEEVEADAPSSSSSEAESEPEENTQTGKRKNRVIRAFQDDNSDEDDVDLLQTPKANHIAPISATQLQLSAHKLFDTEIQRTASDEENELLGLCSGRFTQSEVSSAAPSMGAALISQIPITQQPASSQAPEELEALCSGTFETQPEAAGAPATNKIISSDEEPAKQAEKEEQQKPRQKKLTKKRPKRKAKLGFSDDEESAEESAEEEEEEAQLESEAEAHAEEVPETFVDYDSEENEVVVQMTKKDRKLRAANFVEKEAELSESEWGSADEDEKNMDKYDIELGDEDEFDREQLRNELGQIHARKMLDKDIREVRKIQELLFEDEEGAVRQRQFRWKNAESGAGFSLDDTRNEHGADGDGNEGSGDEENEHLWRKIRYEREQLLLEKGLKGVNPAPLSPAVQNSNAAVRKLTIITAKKTTVELKKSSPFLISKSVSTAQQQQQAVRGSFLVRDKDTLNKLAGLTKGAAGDVDGAAGTVSVKSAKAKNFVFATLTEEEHESQKRKAADLLNSSSETGINFMKKPRMEPRREKCLIDQLL